jgi:hypothetical protein
MIHSSGIHLRPDWVILGVETGLPEPEMRYMVLASDTLSAAEVEATVDELMIHTGPLERIIPYRTTYEIRASAASIVIVYGPDYGTCLRRLLTDWSPGSAGPDGQLPGIPELARPITRPITPLTRGGSAGSSAGPA